MCCVVRPLRVLDRIRRHFHLQQNRSFSSHSFLPCPAPLSLMLCLPPFSSLPRFCRFLLSWTPALSPLLLPPSLILSLSVSSPLSSPPPSLTSLLSSYVFHFLPPSPCFSCSLSLLSLPVSPLPPRSLSLLELPFSLDFRGFGPLTLQYRSRSFAGSPQGRAAAGAAWRDTLAP